MSRKEKTYPILPLRDIVVFPSMIVPLFVGRPKSVKALEIVADSEKELFLAAQMDPKHDDPTPENIYKVGVVAHVLQLLKLPDGTVKVLVEGKQRMKIDEFVDCETHLEVVATEFEAEIVDDGETRRIAKAAKEAFAKYSQSREAVSEETLSEVNDIADPALLADVIAGHMGIEVNKKQELLESSKVYERLEKILSLIETELSVFQVEKKIRRRVKTQMERTQKEYYLNEQMKAIQKELGDNSEKSELSDLEKKIAETKFTEEAKERALGELRKLRQMGSMSSEATVVRNYLDWLLEIPWGVKNPVKSDIRKAEKILDRDHYALEKVKERILEYIAVQQRVNKITGPILCLVGPPGVGKTSLGQSVAKATGREFVRVSLGGVRDEAEIRGHRRTYIGSMPGRIIQSLRKVKSINPLLLLDEIDKLGNSFRGDPASAMLEVLDPEQNSKFVDHYLDLDYDLSSVMFITTANYLDDIPYPLRDRMEIITLSGYTEDEKIEIAKRHIVPKQKAAHGIESSELRIDKNAIEEIIRTYTREAGVRNMEREIAKLCRKAVTKLVKDENKRISVSKKNLRSLLGLAPYQYGLAEKEDQVGVVTGLAWTTTGGDLLSIEAVVLPGKGRMKTTGTLGNVMKESIDAASSYVRSIAPKIGFKPNKFEKIDIHVHVPDGATPKDGPSAGIAMVTSIVSVLTGIPVRRDIAMTGEVTLRGTVLPIGGLKAKLLAAIRGGITTVLIPEKNVKDLSEIPDEVKNQLEIKPVSSVSDVLGIALTMPLVPIEWEFEHLQRPDLPGSAVQEHVDRPSSVQH